MIEIKDFFGYLKEEDYTDYKVHFAIGGKNRNNESPLRAFVQK